MAAKLFHLPFRPALSANGLVVTGAQLHFYLSGTTTRQAVFADAALTTELSNPVQANAAGVWPSIYLDETKVYRAVLTDSNGTVLDEQDPYLADVVDALTPAMENLAAETTVTAAAASAAATRAQNARDVAINAPASTYYASIAEGEAATATGGSFAVGPGNGTAAWYRRTASGSEAIFEPATQARVRMLPIPEDFSGLTFAERFTTAVQALSDGGGGTLTIPPGDYQADGLLIFPYSVRNVTVVAYGATIRDTRIQIQGGYGQAEGQFLSFLGGTITESSGLDSDWLLDITGKDILIRDTAFRCVDANDNIAPKPGYVGFLRVDAINGGRSERVTLENVTFEGSNGLLVAGHGHRIIRNRWINASMYQNVFGGDDAVAIKAIGESSSDIEVSDCHFEGYAGFVSLGSEIGTNSADDPSFSIGISDIRVLRNNGVACSSILYVKPGAINQPGEAYDYRNGLVDKVFVRDNVLEDLTGQRMLTPIAIHMGRGSKLGRLEMTNNTIRGRMQQGNTSALNAVMQVMIRNLGAGSIVENINVDGLHFIDPTGSVANNGSNGFRPRFFLQVEREHPTQGSIGRIRLNNLTLNGTSGCAVFVGAGVTGPIELNGADFTALSSNPPSADFDAAIVDNSGVVKVTGSPRFAMSGAQVPVKAAASKNVTGGREVLHIGDVPAGNTTRYAWSAPFSCQITNIYIINDADIGLDSTNYRVIGFRRRSNGNTGATFLAKNTVQGDGDTTGDFTAGVPKKLNANMIQSAAAIFAPNDVLVMEFSADTGASTVFTRARLVIEYVQLDRPA